MSGQRPHSVLTRSLCSNYTNRHLQRVAAAVFGILLFNFVFYSSHWVRSTFLSVICLGGARLPLPLLHSFSLSLSLLPALWVICETVRVCARSSICVCVCISLSAPGWGILSCCVLSWAECSGDRKGEEWGGWRELREARRAGLQPMSGVLMDTSSPAPDS